MQRRRVALNFIGIIAKELHIDILAFALMSNHFHFIIQGEKVDVLEFFRRLKKRLSYFLARKGRPGVLDPVEPKTQDITSLTYREKRAITRSSGAELNPSIRVRDEMIAPECFVNYKLVERLFPHARKFTWWVFKNVEAQVGVARSLDEHPNLSDDELFIVTMRICENDFGKKSAKEMTEQEQKKLAVRLKNDWYASNAQIARLSGLSPVDVDDLFPLAAKKR